MKYLLTILLLICNIHLSKSNITYYNKNQPENPVLFCILYREGLILNKYNCPAGKKTIGVGNTHSKEKITTINKALDNLSNQMIYYHRIIMKRWPYLTVNQSWAVTSFAINVKWKTAFNSSFSKALDRKEIPHFEKYCYYGRTKSYNLLQSRLYEKGLFCDDIFVNWYHPNFNKRITLPLETIEEFYKVYFITRIK